MTSDGTKSPLPAMPLNYLPVATGIDGSDDLHLSGVPRAPSFLPAEKPIFESLDIEDVDNTVYRAASAARTPIGAVADTSLKWTVCLLIGAATAVAAFLVNLGVENIAGLKFYLTLTVIERLGYMASFVLYATINAILVLSAVVITLTLGPAAAGSGISEVKAYLNGVDVPGVFHLRTLVAKLIGAMGSVAGGLAIGKEGPFVHAGAAIAAIISQGGSSRRRSPWFRSLWNDEDRSNMVACGAAAGVAAAFRSPVGGVLFVLEELVSRWNSQLLVFIFFTTAVVSIFIRLMMKACTSVGCGFFGSGGIIIFEVKEGQDNYEILELLPVLLLGVVGGLLGSGFVALTALVGHWRKTVLWPRWGARGKMLEALVVSLMTSIVSFCLPMMLSCQPCPVDVQGCPRIDNLHSGNFVSFGCVEPRHHYNGLATLFFNTQDDAIRSLFSTQTKREYTVVALTLFMSCFYSLSVLAYGLFLPTGLFVPTILCGAAYGRLVGIFAADLQQNRHIDEGTYALLGAASFLGGSMRLTMSACVMLLELTDSLALLPLIMVVLLIAKVVGDGSGVKSIYEVLMDTKGLPYLPPRPDGFTRHVTVKEVCGQPPVVLRRIEQVRYLLAILRCCEHNSFSVMGSVAAEPSQQQGGQQVVLGVVLRQHILHLLADKRALQPGSDVWSEASRVATIFDPAYFSKPMSTQGMAIRDLSLTDEDLDKYLDLGPYANPSFYVVQEDASVNKAYTLFRTLGLRHLIVIPRANQVAGIITRADLLPGNVDEECGGQYTTDGRTMGPGPSVELVSSGIRRLGRRSSTSGAVE